ncbi:DNA-3-methyladenine glycosylase family protein [Allostreptomyces psammosilenae]|uniref:3-methyladenine DNA glycosylase/8-oxoguanine DNA glycosylase n=1 Tax=Allostreptomyces psammosilenae TaxID=1892865 RepID=A0A852ZV77_9ACTN|nr:DNA-3-methyladenine glycosylase 2 family protein [Allostreptomyces psammosilenae]NYI06149.1 3-methyladenine DNA glycosylase/8-oxoguanine DNA glycosylase [Allostreptomyces psammosilenae]
MTAPPHAATPAPAAARAPLAAATTVPTPRGPGPLGTPAAVSPAPRAATPTGRGAATPREHTRRYRPGHPLDLGALLEPLRRGPGDPACAIAPDGSWWRASRTPDGPGTLRLVVDPAAAELRATAWGPGAERLLDGLPDLLGAADRPEEFQPRIPLLAEAVRRNPGLRLGRSGAVLESLIPAILEQKVTCVEAYRGWRLLLRRFGEPAPGPAGSQAGRMRVPLAARHWAMVPSWEWHRAGVDAKRASTAVRAARLGGRLDGLAALPAEEAARLLCTVPGIGPWTAAETLQRSHGAPDQVSVGDYHLPAMVGWALAGDRHADDETMLRLLQPWAGQRHRVCRLLAGIPGARPPRRGPRLSPREFRDM